MTLKNLNISTDTQDSIDLLLSPLQESGLKQLIINYHSNKVREIIADNTDEFSVFHYEETKLINEIDGISYWSVRDIGTYKSAVINSNKEFIIPFGYYNYIEKSSDNPEYICCRQGNSKLLYDYKGNLIEGSPQEYISEYREKFIKNKYAQQVVEEINKRPILSDLRNGSLLEELSDVVVMIYRENYYEMNNEISLAEILVRKNNSGLLGNFYLKFNNGFFENMDNLEKL